MYYSFVVFMPSCQQPAGPNLHLPIGDRKLKIELEKGYVDDLCIVADERVEDAVDVGRVVVREPRRVEGSLGSAVVLVVDALAGCTLNNFS